MKKTPMLSALLAGVLLTLCACASGTAPASQPPVSALPTESVHPEGDALTLTDMMDRAVTLDGYPQRVVALLASDVEILYAIGAGDLLVGVGEYCNYPAEALEKSVVASGAGTNLEQILALTPDVVVMGAMAQDDGQVQQLERAGVPVVQTNASSIQEVYENIRLLGALTDRVDEAKTLETDMQAGLADVAFRAGDGTKSIYFEVSPLEYGLWTAGNHTFMQELCNLLNIKNLFSDVEGWTEISEEQVLQRNPDYIATVTMYYGDGPTPDEEIMSRSGWQDVTAVKEGRIYCADNDMLTRPGPRLVEAARLLADFVYGP